jgi:hypothetical protein
LGNAWAACSRKVHRSGHDAADTERTAMPFFANDALKQLADEYGTLQPRYDKLFSAYVKRDFKNDKAKEYGTYGFPRRLNILLRCVQNVFNLLPPESDKISLA